VKCKSVGSDFGSDRSAHKTQIYDLRADLVVGKKPTSRLAGANFKPFFIAVFYSRFTHFASVVKYVPTQSMYFR
jgi:hypothetical protein